MCGTLGQFWSADCWVPDLLTHTQDIVPGLGEDMWGSSGRGSSDAADGAGVYLVGLTGRTRAVMWWRECIAGIGGRNGRGPGVYCSRRRMTWVRCVVNRFTLLGSVEDSNC